MALPIDLTYLIFKPDYSRALFPNLSTIDIFCVIIFCYGRAVCELQVV